MLFQIVLGDWSDDGHGKTGTYIVTIPDNLNLTHQQLSDNYAKNSEALGFSADNLFSEYEEYAINRDKVEKLEKAGLNFIINEIETWTETEEEIQRQNQVIRRINESRVAAAREKATRAARHAEMKSYGEQIKEARKHDDYFDDMYSDEEIENSKSNDIKAEPLAEITNQNDDIEIVKLMEFKVYEPPKDSIYLEKSDPNYYNTIVLRVEDDYDYEYYLDGDDSPSELVKIIMFIVGNGLDNFSWKLEDVPFILGNHSSITSNHSSGYGLYSN